jgi:hypothetical protein
MAAKVQQPVKANPWGKNVVQQTSICSSSPPKRSLLEIQKEEQDLQGPIDIHFQVLKRKKLVSKMCERFCLQCMELNCLTFGK